MIDESEIVELKILQLLESEARWWTIEEISLSLNLSKATIQKYLGNLKTRIDSFSNNQIKIETSTSKGIFLHRFSSFNVQVIYTQILKELVTFSIFNSFLYDERVSIIKLSSENFMSVASLRRKYKTYNAYFEPLNLSIKKDIFSGDERQIRWFYSEFYWQIFKGTEWPFRLIPKDFMNGVVDTIQSFFNMEIIPEVKEEMMYWVTVHCIRHIKGHRVPEDPEIKNYALNNPLFQPFIDILKNIFPNEAKNRDDKMPGEMQYLFLLLSALPVMEKNTEYSHMVYQAHQKGNTLMYQMTQDWLVSYESTFGSINSKEKRYRIENKLLRIHSFSYLSHMGDEFISKKSYVEEIIDYHPRFVEKMNQIHDSLSKTYSVITRNRHYLIENYVLLAMEELPINQFERTVRIALSFSKGILYESVVRKNIQAYFSGRYKLEFVGYLEPKEIFITDLPYVLEEPEYMLLSAQTKLTPRDFENIENAIIKYI